MSLTIQETIPPVDTDEIVPGGGEDRFIIEPLREAVYADPVLSESDESGVEDVETLVSSIEMEEKLSADPSLKPEEIKEAFNESFYIYPTWRPGPGRVELVTKDINELPFAKLLLTALGKAQTKEEHDRIKNSFYSSVSKFLPAGREFGVARNKINAAVDVYFENLEPFVDYDREDEFIDTGLFGSASESEEDEKEELTPEEVKEEQIPEEVKEERKTPAEKEAELRKLRSQQQFEGYDPTLGALGPGRAELKEEPSFKDVGDLFDTLFRGDVIRLLQASEGDEKFDQAEYEEQAQEIIEGFITEFKKEYTDDSPTPREYERIADHIKSSIPNPSLRDILLQELELLRRGRIYEEEELKDLPPHTVQPYSLVYGKRLGEYKLPGRYQPIDERIEPVRGISQEEKEAARQRGYTPSEYVTKRGRKTVWIGPMKGQWVFEEGAGNFKNVKRRRRVLGAEEGEIVEFVRGRPAEVPVEEIQRDSEMILQEQRRISEREPDYRTNRSKKLGDITVQWSAGRPQRDIVIPAHARFEDVVKLAEILRLESGTLIDNSTKESLQIGKQVPISVIISYIQTMLARNVGHELYFLWQPSKRASGIFLGGGLMRYFQKPLMRHKQYHSSPKQRFKEYVSKTPLSAMSRHHRGSGIPSGAPPGWGWHTSAPKTFQPFAFENAGAYPLPRRSYDDTDALDKDPRALGTPFGSLPPGLGGPYMLSQEGVGGQIADRPITWRDPSGGAKVSDIATGVAGVSGALAATGVGAIAAAPIAAVSGIVAGLGKIFGF